MAVASFQVSVWVQTIGQFSKREYLFDTILKRGLNGKAVTSIS
jgi:hypothetical protein